MEVVATAKWVRTTARKARLVTQMVEGLPVAEALVLLRYSPRSAARDVAKVIKSAAAMSSSASAAAHSFQVK